MTKFSRLGSVLIIVSAFITVTPSYTKAQESPQNKYYFSTYGIVGVLSSYVWRGYLESGLSPYGEIDFIFSKGKTSSIDIGIMPVMALQKEPFHRFLDKPKMFYYPYISLSHKNYSLMICDYVDDFELGDFHKVYHAFDFTASATLNSIPLTISWSTILFGDDDQAVNPDTGNKHQEFSSYIELSYTQNVGKVELSANIGASPWATTYMRYLYPDMKGFNVLETGISAKYKLPIKSKYCTFPVGGIAKYNPTTGKFYLSAHLAVTFLWTTAIK